jgi:hypothetical protein
MYNSNIHWTDKPQSIAYRYLNSKLNSYIPFGSKILPALHNMGNRGWTYTEAYCFLAWLPWVLYDWWSTSKVIWYKTNPQLDWFQRYLWYNRMHTTKKPECYIVYQLYRIVLSKNVLWLLFVQFMLQMEYDMTRPTAWTS